MTRFILVRIFQSIIALVGIAALVFILVRASGDPTTLMRTSTTTEEQIQEIRRQLGLDQSYPVQFGIFMKQLVTLNLGESMIKRRPVTSMIAEALPKSLRLGVSAFVIAMVIAVALGVLAATRRDGWMDNGVKFIAILGQALPGFWVAIILIFIFGVVWPVLPADPTMSSWKTYILPVASTSFFLLPGMMRLVRSTMLDVLDSEYVKLARIKGLPERIVIWKHALRNAMIAPLTAAGMIFAGLITGMVIIETVFAIPGVGRLLVDGVVARDFPIVQGITIFVAVIVLGVNLVVDILYAYIDPQIRFQRT